MKNGVRHKKAIAKTVSWRGLSFVLTTVGVWVVTGRPSFAASVGLAEVVVKSGGYYFHECLWDWIGLRMTRRGPLFSRFFPEKEKQQCQVVS